MKTVILSLIAGVAAATLASGQAKAALVTYDIPAADGYVQNFYVNADGTLSFGGDPTNGHYNAVQQQDKVYSNFTGLVANESVDFGFTHVGGTDIHTVTFGSGAFGMQGAAIGYNISILPSATNVALIDTASALVQSRGSSTLLETLSTNEGAAGPIDFTVTTTFPSPSVYSGVTAADFAPGTTSVNVVDRLTINAGGSAVNSVENDFTQSVPGPVPGAGLGVLAALLGLGLVARARGLLGR